MAAPASACGLPRAQHGTSAADRVLDDAGLLARILWASRALHVRDLCAAACVRRAWRDAVRDDAQWLPLLRAAAPSAAALENDLMCRGCGAFKRAMMQLYRLGAASLPPRFGLRDYTLLVDVTDETGAAVACAAVPLSGLVAFRDHLRLQASTVALPDGGGAAALFLARLARGETTRQLQLRLLLRRVDGAAALLASAQSARRFEDLEDANDPLFDDYAGEGLFEHGIWEAREHSSERAGAVTWHSSDAPPDAKRLFGRLINVGPCVAPGDSEHNSVRPGRWTWRLQFPADAGAATQLSRLTLRIGLRVRSTTEPVVTHASLDIRPDDLLAMLGQRDAETVGLWVPF